MAAAAAAAKESKESKEGGKEGGKEGMEVEGMEVEGVAAAPYVPDFSTLLSKDGFHRALYTCAAEVVMKINNHTALSFPRSLQVFEVSPFDIYSSP